MSYFEIRGSWLRLARTKRTLGNKVHQWVGPTDPNPTGACEVNTHLACGQSRQQLRFRLCAWTCQHSACAESVSNFDFKVVWPMVPGFRVLGAPNWFWWARRAQVSGSSDFGRARVLGFSDFGRAKVLGFCEGFWVSLFGCDTWAHARFGTLTTPAPSRWVFISQTPVWTTRELASNCGFLVQRWNKQTCRKVDI